MLLPASVSVQCMQSLLLSLLRPTPLSSFSKLGDVSLPSRQKPSPPPAFSEQHFALLLHALAHTQSTLTDIDTIGPSRCPVSQSELGGPVLPGESLSLSPLQCLPEFLEAHLGDFTTRATPQGLAVVFSAVAKLDSGRFPGIVPSLYQSPTTSVQQAAELEVSSSSSYVSCPSRGTSEDDEERKEDLVDHLSADLLLVSCCERVFLGVNESPGKLGSSRQTTGQGESCLADMQDNRQLQDSCGVAGYSERRVEEAHGKETQTGQFDKHKTSTPTILLPYSDLGQQEGFKVGESRLLNALWYIVWKALDVCYVLPNPRWESTVAGGRL